MPWVDRPAIGNNYLARSGKLSDSVIVSKGMWNVVGFRCPNAKSMMVLGADKLESLTSDTDKTYLIVGGSTLYYEAFNNPSLRARISTVNLCVLADRFPRPLTVLPDAPPEERIYFPRMEPKEWDSRYGYKTTDAEWGAVSFESWSPARTQIVLPALITTNSGTAAKDTP
jgi:hypothetical protein